MSGGQRLLSHWRSAKFRMPKFSLSSLKLQRGTPAWGLMLLLLVFIYTLYCSSKSLYRASQDHKGTMLRYCTCSRATEEDFPLLCLLPLLTLEFFCFFCTTLHHQMFRPEVSHYSNDWVPFLMGSERGSMGIVSGCLLFIASGSEPGGKLILGIYAKASIGLVMH